MQKALALNMMYRGCITDPNAPGSEKVVVASVNDKWLQEPRMHISSMEIGAEDKLLSPQAAFAVKGWNRSVAALLVLRAACELGEDLIKAGWLLHVINIYPTYTTSHCFTRVMLISHGKVMPESVKEPSPQFYDTHACSGAVHFRSF